MSFKVAKLRMLQCSIILIGCFSVSHNAFSDKSGSARQQPVKLNIYGAAYLSEMQPLLDGFEQKYPHITIQYKALSSNYVDRHVREDRKPRADITISSVMDLQIHLVNDGYALTYKSKTPGYADKSGIVPRWSQWRDELFGFSFEPAVIVFNKAFLENKKAPSDRVELLSFIRYHSDNLMGKIGIFDIRTVGIGYLLWSFERVQATNYGQFLELFNYHHARTFNSSYAMLQAVSDGEIVMAYNIMGSYAKSWQDKHQDIVMVRLRDYTPVIIRSAFINKTSSHPEQAKLFIDYLLSYSGQKVMAEQTNMPPVRTDIRTEKSAYFLREQYAQQLKPLPLDVSLLVFSDQSKKEIVITEWENALKEYE